MPFKIKLKNPKNKDLEGRELISGFEFYKVEFNLQTEIEQLQSEVHKITGDGDVMKLFNKNDINKEFIKENPQVMIQIVAGLEKQ